MPKIRTVHEPNPKFDSAASWLALALAVGAAIAYLLLWSLLNGTSGCGPPGHSTSGRIFSAAPFVLPLAAAGVLLVFGATRRWHGPTLARAAITTVGIGGVLEVFVFLLEFAARHCGE
jgi:hypothetical protein